MLFSLEVLPAAEGDCLLLHWTGPCLAVIDGGPRNVFENTLGPRLEAIRQKRSLPTLVIDLVMVSHVDNDHIIGVKELFSSLRHDETAPVPVNQRKLKADRLWHNAFTDILGDDFKNYYTNMVVASLASVEAATDATKLAAALAGAGLDGVLPDHEAIDLALVLAGHAEGRQLRDDHQLLYAAQQIARLNAPFQKDGKALPVMRCDPAIVASIKGLKLEVIGPSEAELKKLRKDFDKYLKEKHIGAPAALAALQDQDSSPTNLSSLVCLATLGGKQILLTGDALGASILQGLDAAGHLAAKPFKIDILKLPHHGSARNASEDFFDSIHADTYVISADGKNSNPDRETLEWLIASRGAQAAYHIVFTYPIADIDARRKAIHEKKAVWKPKEHSIQALLDDCQQQNYAFTYACGKALIELGDDKIGW